MSLKITKKIIRKKILARKRDEEDIPIYLEAIWANNQWEKIRVVLNSNDILNLSHSELDVTLKILKEIHSEASNTLMDDISLEWILTDDEGKEIHITAEKKTRDERIFELWMQEREDAILISEEKFRKIITFLDNFSASSTEILTEPESETMRTSSITINQEQEPSSQPTTRLQSRIAELKAQFYRDIEMIARELEEEKETMISEEEESQTDELLEETTGHDDLSDKIDTNSPPLNESLESTSTLVDMSPENVDDLTEEWIDSLESLLNIHQSNPVLNNPASNSQDAVLDGRSQMNHQETQSSMSPPNVSQPTQSEDEITDEISVPEQSFTEKNEELLKNHSMEPKDDNFLTESILDSELEDFFGKLMNNKKYEKKKDS